MDKVTEQPQVEKTLCKVAESYDHFGVLVDLYGEEAKQWGVEVQDVALAGSTVSLGEWFSASTMRTMECRVEYQRIADKSED